VRPPSHHAAPDVADGYCFVNGVALAAVEALAQGCRRVAVVDWDVHHGNGSQEGFCARNDVLVVSLHMNHGAWGKTHPQTGGVEEIGHGPGEGYNLNLPLPMGCGDDTYTKVVERCVVPYLDWFKPDIILVSNGQDAGQFDPNGRQLVTMRGFHRMARMLRNAAERLCSGHLVAVQEGGYNPAYALFCAYATVAGFLNADLDLEDPLAFYPDDGDLAEKIVAELVDRHPLLRA
jgi:acetoin utilization deacetylase AcuC-like enzyme